MPKSKKKELPKPASKKRRSKLTKSATKANQKRVISKVAPRHKRRGEKQPQGLFGKIVDRVFGGAGARVRAKAEGKLIGKITHYFPKVKAGVIVLKGGTLEIGDRIYIMGHTTQFKQKITSMEINRHAITKAKKGDEIGIQVKSRVRTDDEVYKLK